MPGGNENESLDRCAAGDDKDISLCSFGIFGVCEINSCDKIFIITIVTLRNVNYPWLDTSQFWVHNKLVKSICIWIARTYSTYLEHFWILKYNQSSVVFQNCKYVINPMFYGIRFLKQIKCYVMLCYYFVQENILEGNWQLVSFSVPISPFYTCTHIDPLHWIVWTEGDETCHCNEQTKVLVNS